jgi:fumarylacetoacetase
MQDSTTEAGLRSFVEVSPDSHFPIQNLPYGVFRPGAGGRARVGVAIGDFVLDVAVVEAAGLLPEITVAGRGLFAVPRLNELMAAGRETWREVRRALSGLLRQDEPRLRDDTLVRERALLPLRDVDTLLPAEVGDYTDFYSSKEHASNVGTMFRGADNALQPNWHHLPVAYHGRASSLIPSEVDVRRPLGQTRSDDSRPPVFGPARELDFELETGFFVGPGNPLGAPIPVDRAAEHIFGMVLVNDWSARDIQRWEYVPLGPFLGKSFATSLSPWVVTMDALEPFRCSGPSQDPEPLPYLRTGADQAYDIQLEVWLQTERMNGPARIAASNFRYLYWNMLQQLAHHTVNGCNLRPGDLLASGTISGATRDSRGSMLELTWRGSEPLRLPGGEERRFLADGDRVTMTGWCQGDGFRVGFGELTARLLPALERRPEPAAAAVM